MLMVPEANKVVIGAGVLEANEVLMVDMVLVVAEVLEANNVLAVAMVKMAAMAWTATMRSVSADLEAPHDGRGHGQSSPGHLRCPGENRPWPRPRPLWGFYPHLIE